MLDSEKLAIAAHLHVALRRRVGRVTDVEWLVKSPEYAREILRVARSDPAQVELLDLAARLEAAVFPAPARAAASAPPPGAPTAASPASAATVSTAAKPPLLQRYIGSLR